MEFFVKRSRERKKQPLCEKRVSLFFFTVPGHVKRNTHSASLLRIDRLKKQQQTIHNDKSLSRDWCQIDTVFCFFFSLVEKGSLFSSMRRKRNNTTM